jgi:hypothetical protein
MVSQGNRTIGSGGATAPTGAESATGGTPGSSGSSTGVGGAAPGVGDGTGSGAGGNGLGAGGASAGSGNSNPMEAGASGTDDAEAGEPTARCPGIPLMPDAGGFVSPTSNPIGIRGSWFVYSDCVDLKGINCAEVASPLANRFPNVAGRMCTSGQTSPAIGAWGAGIALELNDGPPQMPYDTVAHGIKGFCFQLSGPRIPSTSIRVAFPTKNNPDNAYFSAVTTPGQHTVLFADTAQGSWVAQKSAFEPTMVMLLQLQIPSTTTAPVPWDFCIEGVSAIMQ